ncbi:hypothetical protein [Lysinibacillus pakistanensis]|uniref:Uncharacterized protein n=1 Tax=Lysinibacillus pakistanensis TaxID=759811 RepID=A0ABX6DA96_9BACI|nr:hypothetical protein GDS87_11675 [Lysinibacillus pakistanensis]
MKIPNDNWLKAVLNFSEPSIITSTTIDLEDWWKNAVNQLKDWEIKMYYIALKSVIEDEMPNGEITSVLFSELENRIIKLNNDLNNRLMPLNTLQG